MASADFLVLESRRFAPSRMTAIPQTTHYHAKYLAHLLLKRGGSDRMERLAVENG